MAIQQGQQAVASDFVSTSGGAGDEGKVPKLNSIGKIDNSCLPIKFGGTGADGSLTITSGTTTINLGGSALVIKNYTNISITGSGKLAFSNSHGNGSTVILRSQGNVTLTSSVAPMIDMSGMGAPGGNGGTSSGSLAAGSAGTNGTSFSYLSSNSGQSAISSAAGGAPLSFIYQSTIQTLLLAKYPQAFVGAGAGGGAANAASNSVGYGGTGGRGGGALIIECCGSFNFTTANGISVAGLNGGDGSVSGPSNRFGAAGGGGGAGFCMILYNTLISASGTINISGGGSGNAASGGSPGTVSGGGGGGSSSAGGSGSNGGGGGSGGTGQVIIGQNTEFS